MTLSADKLGKLILMLSSPNDGEAVAAVRAIERTLRNTGHDWHALAVIISGTHELTAAMNEARDEIRRLEDKINNLRDQLRHERFYKSRKEQKEYSYYDMDYQQKAERLFKMHQDTGLLKENAAEFVRDMMFRTREPTEPQAKWLDDLWSRYGRRCA
jgi:Mg2+ and Co2+ transporter CorA